MPLSWYEIKQFWDLKEKLFVSVNRKYNENENYFKNDND